MGGRGWRGFPLIYTDTVRQSGGGGGRGVRQSSASLFDWVSSHLLVKAQQFTRSLTHHLEYEPPWKRAYGVYGAAEVTVNHEHLDEWRL